MSEFELVVGLSPVPVTGVAGPELVRPPESVGAYTLVAHVIADGFTVRAGEAWRLLLEVTTANPYPITTLHLTAAAQDVAVHARTIQVLYSVDGHTMGIAARSIAVVQPSTPTLAATAASQPPPSVAAPPLAAPPSPADQLQLVPDGDAPDLTVRITAAADGRLAWTFESGFADIDVPDAPIVDVVVGEPEHFANDIATKVSQHEGKPGLYQHLRGIGVEITEAVPDELWSLLQLVAERAHAAGRLPTVLLLSAEPFVPWELAVVDHPWRADLPPFLGAQATVGRWVLRRHRPMIPPPRRHVIGRVAVVWGVYERQGWSRLYAAEDEAAALLASLPSPTVSAQSVDATLAAVIDCLQGTPAVDAIHFAVHGTYDPAAGNEGLVLIDGQLLDPMTVQGTELSGAPFVYLNACQSGSGSVALSAYSGIAAAFLAAGACAVIAPLWKIGDNDAADLAEAFYPAMFAGRPPAEVVREQRAGFVNDPDTSTATMLAYQFFGNPTLRVERAS